MNYRALFIIIAFLAVLNISALYLLKGKSQVKNTQINPFQSADSKTVTLPTNPNLAGIESVRAFYTFKGKITEIKTRGERIIIKLDITGSDIPEFETVPLTFVFLTKDQKTTAASISDLKIRQNVVLTDAYDLKNKIWELQAINILQ